VRRRTFLLGLLAVPLLRLLPARRARAAALPAEAKAALPSSPFVYVSPLRSDGRESTCHAEVWYGWIDGRVLLITSSDGWKARALARGLDRARLWVGDHGRWKRLGIAREDFRKAPSFDARASKVSDPALLDRLMAEFRRKYPAEIGKWEPRMRAGFADGGRTLIAYEPL
jgi:hypothetical protein